MTAAEQLTEPLAYHGEGPVWDPALNALHWVDMLAGDVLTMMPGDEPSRRHVGTVVAAVRPRPTGGLVMALERSFAVLDSASDDVRVIAEAFQDRAVRMNEGGCDPQGRFYCGTMAYAATPGAGTLYRLDPDGTVHIALANVTVSNGLAWSADGRTAYYVDSATQRIDAFDYDSDAPQFLNRRPIVSIPHEQGSPDGLTIDEEGGLWVALWDGGAVHRYTADGRLSDVVEVPGVSRVTACTFGGPGMSDLFITTSALDLDRREPAAGALFQTRPGVAGLPTRFFAG